MSKKRDPVPNYESFISASDDDSDNGGSTSSRSSSSLSPPIFILCNTCYWCATYFDKTRIPKEDKCPQCNSNNNGLTSFPIIMYNESFTFD
jgi:hypothetical protein